MQNPSRQPADDMPMPHPALVLVGVAITTYLESLPPKHRRRFMERMSHNLALTESWSKVARLRPSIHDEEVAEAVMQAGAWWHRAMGPVMARLA
jgi:hypothetical protein